MGVISWSFGQKDVEACNGDVSVSFIISVYIQVLDKITRKVFE